MKADGPRLNFCVLGFVRSSRSTITMMVMIVVAAVGSTRGTALSHPSPSGGVMEG